ncbi:efflux RND transporter permease subunit [Peijinzhouia sedimentorum]
MIRNLSILVIVSIIAISILAVIQLSKLKFDYDFENFFPQDHPALEYYLDFRQKFENDNDYLLIALKSDQGIFNAQYLSKVDSLSELLSSLENVEEVLSLTSFSEPIIGPMGVISVPIFDWEDKEKLAKDSIRLLENEGLPSYFISNDRNALAIMLRHTQQISKEDGDKLTAEVNQAIEDIGFAEYHVAGKARAQGVFVSEMQNEIGFYLSISGLIVIVFLWLSYRSAWLVLVPLLVVGLAVLWLVASMAFMGKPLDILSIIMPNIMFVIGMSDVVHILTRYLEELRKGSAKWYALKTSYLEVGRATLLTSITTAIGFASLATSSIAPIKELGLYTAFGVLLAFLLAFTLLPAILYLIPIPKVAKTSAHFQWRGLLNYIFLITARYPKRIFLISTLLATLSIVGLYQLKISTYLIDDIPLESDLKQDFIYFDTEFGGSKPFEMSVSLPENQDQIFDKEVLQEIERVEDYLRNEFGIDAILSPVQLAKSINKANNGGVNENYRLPSNELEWRNLSRNLKRFQSQMNEIPLVDESEKTARISGRMGDIGSELALEKVYALNEFLESNTNPAIASFKITGTSYLIDINNELIAKSTLQGLGIALVAIALITGLLFRSWRMTFLAIIPNILPILMIAGIMGFLGINLKLSTAIIFTIAFGIVVDDSIHFLSKLNLELKKGHSYFIALRRSFLSGGKAIILTTLILAGGFFALIFSSFSGVHYIGLLIFITLCIALILDLTLLPALISSLRYRLERKRKDASIGK